MSDTQHGFYLAIGKQGSGKTCFITKLMYDNLNNRKVYSNYTLFGIDYIPITIGDENDSEKAKIDNENGKLNLLKSLDDNPNYFNNSILLIDEIHLYWDSRDFMKKYNRKIQTFFSQLRKRNILLLATTQYIMNVDIRIRRQCMNVFDMTHLKDDIFKVVTCEIDGYYTEEISDYLVNLSEYYHLYNTNEIIL